MMATLKINQKLLHMVFGARSQVIVRGKNTVAADYVHKDKGDEDFDDQQDIPVVLVQEEVDVEEREAQINKLRNKSGLLPQHLKMLKEEKPYADSQSWIHETIKYRRMMFGRYGLASGVDPRFCFDSPAERQEKNEYMKVAFPHTLTEMMQTNSSAKAAQAAKIQAREDDIAKKLDKLEQWKHELYSKKAKRESEAKAAKDRKDRLVEEVRRHFGFKLDARDERFKEMLEKKEKEDKKKQKEVKRLAKEVKVIEKLMTRNKGDQPETEPSADTEK